MAYIFGGDTGVTQDDLKRRQNMAQLMMMRGSGAAPKTAVEGMNSAANSITGALLSKKLGAQQQAGQQEFGAMFGNAIGNQGQFAGSQPAPRQDFSGPIDDGTDRGIGNAAMAAIGKPAQGDMGQFVRQGLIERGLPEHVADGFVMNFQDESGLNPGINEANPIVPGSRGGFGLAQWTGPRRKQLEAFAQQRGVDVSDPNLQMDFLVSELQGSESGAASKILASQDAGGAASSIVNDFLRPSEEHRQRRSAKYAGSAPSVNPALMQLMGDERATDQQRNVLSMLMQQQMQAADPMRQLQMQKMQQDLQAKPGMSPYQTAQLDLQNRKLEAQLSGDLKTGTNVTVNNAGDAAPLPGYNKLPAGLVYKRDQQGNVIIDESGVPTAAPVIGGPADTSKEDAVRQQNIERTGGVVTEDIDRALGIIEQTPSWTTGLGSVMKDMPGTEAKSLSSLLETIKANVGFDRLQQMRDASKTGGALGAINQTEMGLLTSALGSLDQALGPEQLAQNLGRINGIYMDIIHGPGQDAGEAVSEQVNNLPDFGAMTDEELDAYIEGGGR